MLNDLVTELMTGEEIQETEEEMEARTESEDYSSASDEN